MENNRSLKRGEKNSLGGNGFAEKSVSVKIALIALSVAVIAVCSYISVPTLIPFTLQTFAVALVATVLGWKLGFVAVFCYLLLGLCGAPVFSGFKSGLSAFASPTGGYLVGFLLIPPCALLFKFFPKKIGMIFSLYIGVVLCYALGTVWFVLTYEKGISVWGALMACVIPYIIPDIIKTVFAVLVGERVRIALKM
ncbi:MAG: biotin transporter BioY [Christensenellaceae bacterium]|nr:biotin transporter BioY [Christensenellaceae bacterium]MDD6927586.1 biotin transporter BioY [bacterium]MDY2850907.1 biotin transporter BioY [Christensenellaceae bacterium]